MLKKINENVTFHQSYFLIFEMKKKSSWKASNKKIVKNVKRQKVNIKKIYEDLRNFYKN